MWVNLNTVEQKLRDSLILTTKLPRIPGTHFINLGRMEDFIYWF